MTLRVQVVRSVIAATLLAFGANLAAPAAARADSQATGPQEAPAIGSAPAAPQHIGSPDNQRPGSQGAPPVEFYPPLLDLGTIPPGQVRQGVAIMQNVGTTHLQLADSRADCSCTAVDLPKRLLAPGENIPVEVEFRSGSVMGPRKSAVKVLFAGYDIIELPINAFVALPVHAEPAYISALPDQSNHRPLSGEFTVKSIDGKPFRVLSVNGGAVPYADPTEAAGEPRNTYRLTWDFTGFNQQTCTDAQGNRIPAWVVIETDHPHCPVMDLEVRHECNRRTMPSREDTWVLQEKRMIVGGVRSGEPTEFEVVTKFIRNRPQDDPVRAVVSDSSQFSAELLGVQQKDTSLICRIRVTPSGKPGEMIYGTLRLLSNRQQAPLIVTGKMR